MKTVDQLLPQDFIAHRVWEYATDLETELNDETFVRPVEQLPVKSLANRLVAAPVTLANGQRLDALLGNIDLSDPISTEHFLTVSVFLPTGQSFVLARYHDIDYSRRDATALAAFLGFALDDVFPMHYDISDVAIGHPVCLRRSIPTAPSFRLSEAEIIALALK